MTLKNLEKQLLSSYESTLALEEKEICEEVDSILSDDKDLIRETANIYCMHFLSFKKDNMNPELIKRCQKYLDDIRNYHHIKIALEDIIRSRKMV